MSAIEWYLVVVVPLGVAPAVPFPLYYRRSAWRSTEVGRALMIKGASIAALFSLAAHAGIYSLRHDTRADRWELPLFESRPG